VSDASWARAPWWPEMPTVTVVEAEAYDILSGPLLPDPMWRWYLISDDGWIRPQSFQSLEIACREALWLMGYDPMPWGGWPDDGEEAVKGAQRAP
jgi:hypothetical protein